MPAVFVDQITVLDCACLDSARGLIGESWMVDVSLSGELNQEDMVIDFGQMKRLIKQILDETIDHRLLVPGQSPQIRVNADADQTSIRMELADGSHIVYQAPPEAVCILPSETIDSDLVRDLVHDEIKKIVPANITNIQVSLRVEEEGEIFHYCHGLRGHDGNCQRLAHGHRGRICVEVDGYARTDIEKAWVFRLRDAYVGSTDDISGRPKIAGKEYIQFEYEVVQGRFFLEIPADRCYLLSTNTTVELMTEHVLNTIRTSYQGAQIKVQLLEGVGKGASATS